MTLRELSIGQKFIHQNVKDKRSAKQFIVKGDPEFNASFGSATRKCLDIQANTIIDKSCRLEVIRLPIG